MLTRDIASSFLAFALTLLLATPSLSQEYQELAPVEGVKLVKIQYVVSETKGLESLEQAVVNAFSIPKGESVPYQYNLVELTKGKKHALVVLEGPQYGGSGGSSAGLFEKTAHGFRLLTRFTLFRNPVVVSETSTKGWRDLVVRTSGGGMPAQFSLLQFDGRGYPSNPTTAAALGRGSQLRGTAVLATKGTISNVIKFISPGPKK